MNLAPYYDDYWAAKDEGVDPERLRSIVRAVQAGERVLDIGCGPGKVAQAMAAKGADVVGLDFSSTVLQSAAQRGVRVVQHDIDLSDLPFRAQTFDIVVFTQTIEHLFEYRHAVREAHRVLKDGGTLILSIPNIAHWRFRLWLLLGRFPYIEDTQTHSQHIRFFTVRDTRELCRDSGFRVGRLQGSSAVDWCPLYHWRMGRPPLRPLYELATRVCPSLFAFHVTFFCEKPNGRKA